MQDRQYLLTPKQDEFIFSEKMFPAFVSGWGSGKSFAGIARAMRFSEESPNNLGLICRMEYTDLRDSTIKDFENYTGLKVNESTKEVRLNNGSVIMFRHASELATLANINLGWFWIEQADEVLTEEQWFYLHGRLRRNAKQRSGWITANVNGHNWIYKLWKEKPHTEDYHLIEATTYDNRQNLPDDFLKSLDNLPEAIYRRMVMNDWSCAEGLVWPEFGDDNICDEFEIPKEWKEVIALDHGFTHPTAVLFGAVDYDGRIIIYDEICESEQLVSYFAGKIKEIEPDYEKMQQVIDPSCKNRTLQYQGRIYSIMDEYSDYGIHFIPAQNQWQAGVNRVSELFKSGKLVIFRRCVQLIDQIKNYKYKAQKVGLEKIPERPFKLNDDLCDALRYLIMSRPTASEPPKKATAGNTHDAWDAYYQKQLEIEENVA